MIFLTPGMLWKHTTESCRFRGINVKETDNEFANFPNSGEIFPTLMSLFVPGEKQALELQWNNQLFYVPKQIKQDKSEVEI